MSFESPRRKLAFMERSPGFSLVVKRNCSISPHGLLRVFALLAGVAIGIATAFALLGAWLILPFAGIEIVALGAAFLLNGRHAADYERIELAGGRLTVEQAVAERTARVELDARLARVELAEETGRARVLLCAPGGEFEIGRHLDAETRVEFAAELAKRLRI
ncbi:MAG TPA: DUF2244 domain-containing protein [Burkholderiales bacterium]|nr:DUF2244 domain-containing protein [Burkholderiales bacterium]